MTTKNVQAVACPSCGAAPGEPCTWAPEFGSLAFLLVFHTRRVLAAADGKKKP